MTVVDVKDGETEEQATARTAAELRERFKDKLMKPEAYPKAIAINGDPPSEPHVELEPSEPVLEEWNARGLEAPVSPAVERFRGPDGEEVEITEAEVAAAEVAESIRLEPITPPSLPTALLGLRQVPVGELVESPTNPRKTFGDLSELVTSIAKMGILQPLVARPRGDSLELVFGHRRLRAAKEAGLAEVPVDVRNLSDVEVLEAQLVENCQRVEIHPMEEAEAYERLHREFGYSADTIAEKVGKSRSWVYSRLKLTALAPEVRKAFSSDKVNASLALLIARIPAHKIQVDALGKITKTHYDGEPMSVRHAAELIHQDYMTDLKAAPFSTKDAFLVPEAGACTDCPKRSKNQPDLFSDLPKSADVCTDLPCFRAKIAAHWDAIAEKAKADGKKVLSVEDSAKVYRYGNQLTWDSPWLDLDTACQEDQKRRTWREILGNLDGVTVHVAADQAKKPHDLAKKDQVLARLKEDGVKWAAKEVKRETERKAARAKPSKSAAADADAERKIVEQVQTQAMARILEEVERRGPDVVVMRIITRELALAFQADPPLLEALGLKSSKGVDLQAFVEKKATEKQLAVAALGLAVGESIFSYGEPEVTPELKALGKALAVDVAAIEKDVRTLAAVAAKAEELKAAEKKTTPAKASKSKPAPKKKAKA